MPTGPPSSAVSQFLGYASEMRTWAKRHLSKAPAAD